MGEHGLAGPGLPGDRVQPLAEPQFGPLDQQQVLDPQLAQHAALCSNGRGPTRPRFPLVARVSRGGLVRAGRLHEVPGADQGEAEGGADEGEDRGDQDDLVEAADEGDVGGVDGFVVDRRRQRQRRRRAREPPEATTSPSPSGAFGSSSESFESTRAWKTAPSAGDAGGDPDLAEGRVDPRAHPRFLHRHHRDRRLADPRVGDADADAGDEEAGQQRRPAPSRRETPCISSRPTPTSGEPGPEQDPDRDPVRERAGDRRDDEAEHGQRQEAQARLQRRVVEHALHVDRQVEEHREHPRREPEGDRGDAVEGGLAEQASGRASGGRCGARSR